MSRSVALPQIYSRRKRQSQFTGLDVYQYDTVPARLRVQVAQMFNDGLGKYTDDYGHLTDTAFLYRSIVGLLRREVAVHELVRHCQNEQMELLRWIETSPSVNEWLDAIEASVRTIDKIVGGDWGRYSRSVRAKPESIVEELNGRFREEGFGYQYVDGDILRVDAEIIHRDVVLPALLLLRSPRNTVGYTTHIDMAIWRRAWRGAARRSKACSRSSVRLVAGRSRRPTQPASWYAQHRTAASSPRFIRRRSTIWPAQEGQVLFKLNERMRRETIARPPPTNTFEEQHWSPTTQIFHRTGSLIF